MRSEWARVHRWDLLFAQWGYGSCCVCYPAILDPTERSSGVWACKNERIDCSIVTSHELVLLLVLAEGTDDAWIQEVGVALLLARSCRRARCCWGLLASLILVGALIAEVDKVLNVPEFFIVKILFIERGWTILYDLAIGIDAGERVEGLWGPKSLVAEIVQIRSQRRIHCAQHQITGIADHGRSAIAGSFSLTLLSRAGVWVQVSMAEATIDSRFEHVQAITVRIDHGEGSTRIMDPGA